MFIYIIFIFFLLSGCSYDINNYFINSRFNNSNNLNEKYIKKIITLNIPILDSSESNKNSFLGAELWLTNNIKNYTSTFIIVPGSGSVSRKNIQYGDGLYMYSDNIELNINLANYLCKEGFNVLLYDKRTCGPSNDLVCNLNYLDTDKFNSFDILINDFNHVYEYFIKTFSHKNKIIALGFNQSTHIILNSKYKNDFMAIILISPIPDSIDKILIDGLLENSHNISDELLKYKLYNRSETIYSIFNSIKNNEFNADSLILGMKVEFWKKWLLETSRSDFLFNSVYVPLILVIGAEDKVYDKYAKNKISRYGIGKNRKFLFFEGCDYNLLTNERLVYRNIHFILKNLLKLCF